MILDSRIKEGKRPLTCLDIEQAQEFVGKECIFSDSYDDYRDIEKYNIETHNENTAILKSIKDDTSNEDYVFENPKIKARYRLILPLEWVKKPETTKFIPYTLDTWQTEFGPGDIVFFRGKKDTCKDETLYKCMYLGYLEKDNRILVILGSWLFSFDELFKLYEINRTGRWELFGRKVETIDLNAIHG